ncbi:glycosyltransferase [Niallia alba]|uniref:glycosyltransferase n=1 Tax=Niallia alba TaxID=2729105 RepID=UPI00399FBF5F
MNIAYVVRNLDFYSGAAKQAYTLAKNIHSKEYKVIIINVTTVKSPNNNIINESIDSGIKIYSIYHKINSLNQFIQMYSILRKENIKLVHIHDFIRNALIASKCAGIKNLLKTTLYKSDDFKTLLTNKNIVKAQVNKFIINNFIDNNIVLTDQCRESNLKVVKNKLNIIRIPNGVTIDNKIDFKRKNNNNFCTVGVVCERKGTLESIMFFYNNFAELHDSKLYVIGPKNGDIPEADIQYFNQCVELIKRLKIEKKVIFLGKVSSKKVRETMSKSKGLIFFSKFEGMPNVVLEALAQNIVPILSPINGVSKEMINDGINGFIIDDPGRKIEITKINNMIQEKSPYELAVNKYNVILIAERYKDVYKKIIN